MSGPGDRLVRVDPPVATFMKLLRQTPERLDLEVRKRFREIAADVRSEARAAAERERPQATGVRRTVRKSGQHWRDLVNSIKSGSTSASPHVAIGSARVPWALGFEFGAGPGKRQFPPWRGSGDSAGYFFWPAVRERSGEVGRQMVAAIDDAMQEAFPQ